jgi:hypothetical protein
MDFINRDNSNNEKGPIICPPNIKPSSNTLKKSGVSLSVQSNATGKRTCVIATVKRDSNTAFASIYCLDDTKNLYLCVRSVKCNERELAIEKLKILFKCMEKNRIDNQIVN